MAKATKTPAAAAAETAGLTSIDNSLPVYEQLIACARLAEPNFSERTPKEDEQVFLRRLAKVVGEAPEEVWQSLEEDGAAQGWFNDGAAEAMKNKAPIPAPEGMPAPAEVEQDNAEAAAPAKKALSKGAQKLAELNAKRKAEKELAAQAKADGKEVPAAVEKKTTTKAPKVAPAPKVAAGPKEDGLVVTLRKIVIENPEVTREEMAAEATKRRGFTDIKDATLSVVRTDTLSVINIAKALGYWKS